MMKLPEPFDIPFENVGGGMSRRERGAWGIVFAVVFGVCMVAVAVAAAGVTVSHFTPWLVR